jgi:hypothetical protein
VDASAKVKLICGYHHDWCKLSLKVIPSTQNRDFGPFRAGSGAGKNVRAQGMQAGGLPGCDSQFHSWTETVFLYGLRW